MYFDVIFAKWKNMSRVLKKWILLIKKRSINGSFLLMLRMMDDIRTWILDHREFVFPDVILETKVIETLKKVLLGT